jgi:hypothetical protein
MGRFVAERKSAARLQERGMSTSMNREAMEAASIKAHKRREAHTAKDAAQQVLHLCHAAARFLAPSVTFVSRCCNVPPSLCYICVTLGDQI